VAIWFHPRVIRGRAREGVSRGGAAKDPHPALPRITMGYQGREKFHMRFPCSYTWCKGKMIDDRGRSVTIRIIRDSRLCNSTQLERIGKRR
jgi:hypothetical protein